MCTLALLFAAYCAVWAMGVQKNVRMNKETSPTTLIVIYVGSLLFAVYFLASAVYLWVYRSFLENYTKATKGNPDAWKKHFWNHGYDRT